MGLIFENKLNQLPSTEIGTSLHSKLKNLTNFDQFQALGTHEKETVIGCIMDKIDLKDKLNEKKKDDFDFNNFINNRNNLDDSNFIDV